jgi:sugar O-acyltransferase (sialic acid O-acetyltransferase NeuD family)
MSLNKLVIFGTSEIAKLAFHYFSMENKYQVLAFTVDAKYINGEGLFGLPVVPAETLMENYPPEEVAIFVGASYSNLNKTRAAIHSRLKSWDYKFASCMSPKAAVLTQDIGENVLIMDNVSVAPSVKIGNNVIVGPNVAICHDTSIKDHIYIAPSACFCGYNLVDDYCVIGASATIAPRVHIGKSNFIGIGAHIFNSTGENEAYLTGSTKKSKMPASSAWMIGLIK